MNINKRLIAGALAGILIIGGGLAFWLAKGGIDTVRSFWSSLTGSYVAKVNEETITRAQLDQWMRGMKKEYEAMGYNFNDAEGRERLASIERYVLDQLIDMRLAMQEAKAKNLVPSDAEVEAELKQYKETTFAGDEAKYQEFLKSEGIDEAFLREVIAMTQARSKLFDSVVTDTPITEEMIADYYEKNKELFVIPEQIQSSHILVATEEEAKAIIAQLNQGANFEELAVAKSTDPSAKENKGNLGYMAREEIQATLVKEFADAVLAMKKGETSKTPVKSQFGYHVIRINDVKPTQEQSLADSRDTIKGTLEIDLKQEQFMAYFSEVRAKAQIENKLEAAAEQPPAGQQQQQPGQ